MTRTSDDPAPASASPGGQATPTGVLLVNTGSPDAPTPQAVRRYLAEFLADPGVVDWPRWLWLPILHGIVLRTRPRRSAALYRRVWTDEGSPLVAITRRQAAALADRLGPGFRVALAMRYGRPGIAAGLADLAGCDPVLVLPLFPQEAAATVGSVVAAVEAAHAADPGGRPAPLVAPPFPTDPGYVGALAGAIEEERRAFAPDHVVLSFHGLPQRVVDRGDPYRTQCEATARAVADRLALSEDAWSLVFQSRFGPERWLEPAAGDLVPRLAARHRRVLVACPGFAADCLETIDEIGHELAAAFRAAGGEALRRVPALNDRPDWIEALARLVERRAQSPPGRVSAQTQAR